MPIYPKHINSWKINFPPLATLQGKTLCKLIRKGGTNNQHISQINFRSYYIQYKPKFLDSPLSLLALSVTIHNTEALVLESTKVCRNTAQVCLCYSPLFMDRRLGTILSKPRKPRIGYFCATNKCFNKCKYSSHDLLHNYITTDTRLKSKEQGLCMCRL